MDANILTQLNWVDIFIVILLIRISYVASRNGSFIEFFKFLGAISATYFSLHYYVSLSGFLSIFARKQISSTEFLDFLSLIILIGLGYAIFLLIRESLIRFVRVEVVSTVNKAVALVLGFTRGLIIAGLLMYLFSVPVVGYLTESCQSSYLGRRTVGFSVKIYENIWNGFMSKFMLHEEFNQAVLRVGEGAK